MLSVKNISKRFKKQQVLTDISFTLEENEIIAILGTSGCGKTSLLKIITGLFDADAGSIELHGSAIDGIPPEQRNIGMVFQNYLLFPFMTVYENIAFGLRMKGIAPRKQKARIRSMAAQLGIEQKLQEYPKSLSAGQQQRVALARVFVLDFPVILLDEPFSNLDPHLRDGMYDVLLSLQQTHKTSIILVTHNAEEAMILSSKIGIIHASDLVQFDTSESVFRYPAHSVVAQMFGNKNALPISTHERDRVFYNDIPFRFSKPRVFSPHDANKPRLLTCHPERVQIQTKLTQRENMLEGKICSLHHLGRNTHVKVQVHTEFVYAVLTDNDRLEIGSPVQVQFPHEHVHIMPD